jgi:exodeoxyribonuclease VII, small subunit
VKDERTFEKAFKRLEEILEKMNDGKISLDDSLKLYEEADQLIISCSKKLAEAEKKIQVLTKERDGKVALDDQGQPLLNDFS